MLSKVSMVWQTIAAIATVVLFHFQIQKEIDRYSESWSLGIERLISILVLATLFIVIYEFIFFILRNTVPEKSQILPRRSYFQSPQSNNLPVYKIEEENQEKEDEILRLKTDTNTQLLSYCESLRQMLVKYSVLMSRPEVRIQDLTNAVREFKSGILKIYFFGTQSTGKSSLVNNLIGRELSPVGPDKCTSCLVRIRGSNRVRAFARYEDGTLLNVDRKDIEKKIREWALVSNRPKELVIETNKLILGQPKIELIDSPGTGSAANEVVNRSIESEIVDEAIKSVAIAVIVYLPSGAQMQSHAELLQRFRKNGISTVGVCNLDSNWASLYGRDKKEAERIIKEAETNIQEKTRAECFRITLADDIEEIGAKTIATAKDFGANSIQDVRDYLVKSLESREVYLAVQTLSKSKNIVKDFLYEVNLHIDKNREYVENLCSQRAVLLNKITEFKSIINQNPNPKSSVGSIAGGAVGLAAGLFAAISLPLAAPVLTVMAAVGGPTAVGTGIGVAMDKSTVNRKKQEYTVKLEIARAALQKTIESSVLIHPSLNKKFSSGGFSLTDVNNTSALENLYSSVDNSLGNNDRYRIYSQYQAAKKELMNMRSKFVHFEATSFKRGA